MANNNKFNQSVYANAYNKKNYTECKLHLKPVESEKVNAYLASHKISKNQLFIQSALYIIDNNINISSFQADSGNKE